MNRPLRVIDTGLLQGRMNIAIDAAMLELRQADIIGDSLRFIHFEATALVGRHQALHQEIKVDHCKANGVGIGRRVTGGGAIYLDPKQLGWALILKRNSLAVQGLGEITKAICEAAAFGLSKLGIDARFRPRNDIEVAGKKISGTGGFFDGDVLMYQGTVLIDLNPSDMVAALNMPIAKASREGETDQAARVTTLKQLLGQAPTHVEVIAALTQGFAEKLNFLPNHEPPSPEELALAQKLYAEEIGTDEFVYEIDEPWREAGIGIGTCKSAGGAVTAYLRKDGPKNSTIREVIFVGDFFVAPPRLVYDLEAHLRGTKIDNIAQAINEFFAISGNQGLLSITADNFIEALTNAAENQN
ncbi:MAG: lipoate-protein ligase A [Hyphomonadaceae bacterium]|nr:MAG: lipoate-protein ligase A [Hyphomonadaceae bacterium]